MLAFNERTEKHKETMHLFACLDKERPDGHR